MTDAAPLVSTVLATHNRAALLPKAAASVLRQSMADLELIVVDDASGDGTRAVLAELAARDQRVRCIRLEASAGPAAARNRGIAAARGAYIAFLDDDDVWLARKLERQLAAFATPPVPGLVYGPTIYVGRDGRERLVGAERHDGRTLFRRLLRGNFLLLPSVLIAREALARVGPFDERLPALEDWELWLRIAAAVEVRSIAEPVARAFFTSGSITATRPRIGAACEALAAALPARFPSCDAAALADLHETLGHEQMLRGRAAAGRAELRRAVGLDPRAPRRMLKLAAAHLGRPAYALGVRAWEAASLGAAAPEARGRSVVGDRQAQSA